MNRRVRGPGCFPPILLKPEHAAEAAARADAEWQRLAAEAKAMTPAQATAERTRLRSEARHMLRRIVNEAVDAGLDSCGWPMSKLRTPLLDKARAVLAALDSIDR